MISYLDSIVQNTRSEMIFLPQHISSYNGSSLATAQSYLNVGNGTGLPVYVGYINLLISSAFYGLNYTPVKKFETGDGMFFQLIVCMGKSSFDDVQVRATAGIQPIVHFESKPSGKQVSSHNG